MGLLVLCLILCYSIPADVLEILVVVSYCIVFTVMESSAKRHKRLKESILSLPSVPMKTRQDYRQVSLYDSQNSLSPWSLKLSSEGRSHHILNICQQKCLLVSNNLPSTGKAFQHPIFLYPSKLDLICDSSLNIRVEKEHIFSLFLNLFLPFCFTM